MDNSFSSFVIPNKKDVSSKILSVDVYKDSARAMYADIGTFSYSSVANYGKGIATDGESVFVLTTNSVNKHDLNGTLLSSSATIASFGNPSYTSIFCFGDYIYIFPSYYENSTYYILNKSNLSIITTTATLSGSGSLVMLCGYNTYNLQIYYINNLVYTVAVTASGSATTASIIKYSIGSNGILAFAGSSTIQLSTYTSYNHIGCDYSKSLNSICFFNSYKSYASSVNEVIAFSLDSNAQTTIPLPSGYYAYAPSSAWPYLRFFCDSDGNFIILFATNSGYNTVILYISTNGSTIATVTNPQTGVNYLTYYANIIITKNQFFIGAANSTGNPVFGYWFTNGSSSYTTKYMSHPVFGISISNMTTFPYHYQNVGKGVFTYNAYNYFLTALESIKT